MKYDTARPYADPQKAARRILEIANLIESVQGGIHIEKVNEPFLFRDGGSPAENGGGMKLAVDDDARIRVLRDLHTGWR